MIDERQKGQQQNRFYGDYVGAVESVSEPAKLMRVQVRVLGVFTDNVPIADLPWAEYRLPVGMRVNDGNFTPQHSAPSTMFQGGRWRMAAQVCASGCQRGH